ncbi:MAG: hypothetical protein LBM60_01355, partial [Clostridium sp.]|nr:hypothetical protein [Clostridium sp.]
MKKTIATFTKYPSIYRRRIKPIFMVVLLFASLFLMMGCNKTQGDMKLSALTDQNGNVNIDLNMVEDADADLYTYTASFETLTQLPETSWGDFLVFDDVLYYGLTEDSTSESKRIYNIYKKSLLSNEDATQLHLSLQSEEQIRSFTVDGEGRMVLLTVAGEENQEMVFSLVKYDMQGNVLFRKSVTDQIQAKQFELQFVGLDLDNRIYITAMNQVFLFDAEGTYQGELTVSTPSAVSTELVSIAAIGQGADGNVYIQYLSDNKLLVAQIDFEGEKQAVSFESASLSTKASLSSGLTGDLLLNSGTFLYDYTAETKTGRKILDWTDSYISGSDVAYAAPLSDGRVVAVLIGGGEAELAFLEKKRKTDTQEKEELVVATFNQDYILDQQVAAFNRDSDKYSITIKQYYQKSENEYEASKSRFQMDLMTSDEIDIIKLGGSSGAAYARAGVFEDLTPYLESSKTLNKEDILPAALQGRTFGERIISIPAFFYLDFYIARNEAIGDKNYLHPRDLLELVHQYPNYQLFSSLDIMPISPFLLRAYCMDFLDWEAGECHFDSAEFIDLLAVLKEFPNRDEPVYNLELDRNSYESRNILFAQTHINSLSDYVFLMMNLGDTDVSFIRGHDISDKPGIKIVPNGGDYAIS